MKKILLVLCFMFFTTNVFSEDNDDQWIDSKKSYKDLVEEGFEVKSYDTTTIDIDRSLLILLFVTVLQKDNEVYECQEYQTMDRKMNTLDMSIFCKELVKPFLRGLGT